MAKLVVLSSGMAGRTHELKVDKTTIGRVEDNSFQIAEPSVSSHHCEILVKGNDVLVIDLNSTNGTFINGEKISEGTLKPGQTLRLGQVELRLENDGASSATAPAPASAPAPAPAPAPSASAPPAPAPAPAPAAPPPSTPKKATDQTVVVQRGGVSLTDLEQGPRTSGFDTSSRAFSKKTNKTNKWFFIGAAILLCIIGVLILYALLQIGR